MVGKMREEEDEGDERSWTTKDRKNWDDIRIRKKRQTCGLNSQINETQETKRSKMTRTHKHKEIINTDRKKKINKYGDEVIVWFI